MSVSAKDVLGENGGSWTAERAAAPDHFVQAPFGPQEILPTAGPRTNVATPGAAPFSAIGLVNLFRGGNLVLVGTGFCCEPDILVTAKHVLTTAGYDAAGVWMGYDARTNASVTPQAIAAYATHATLDLAVFVLASNQPAHLPIGGTVAADDQVQIAGYGYAYNDGKPRFTFGQGKVAAAVGSTFSYVISTREGDSGAPVTAANAVGQKVVGLHTGGQSAGGDGNTGLVFSPAVTADLRVMIDWARTQVRR